LAGARGPGDEGHGAGPVPIAERLVERTNARRHALFPEYVTGFVELVGEPGKDVEAARSDSVRMFARAEVASPQFQYLQHPELTLGRPLGGQRDDRIGDRELRSICR